MNPQEELRNEFHEWFKTARVIYEKEFADWWLSKLAERGQAVKKDTLSELIAKCGEDFYWLQSLRLGGKITKWQAVAFDEDISATDSTPEEALANLYIALKSK